MAEFFKETEKKRKARRDWQNKFKDNFERALRDIDKHHERKLLTFQVVALALVGAIFINLLTAVIFDLFMSLAYPITTQAVFVDAILGVISSLSLIVISILARKQLHKYKPPNPFLPLVIEPSDIEHFVEASEFQQIMNCLEKGMLTDFKVFGDHFFKSLDNWFCHMFSTKVNKTPIKESEELLSAHYQKLPTIIKEYDISALSLTGVKFTLEVALKPRIVFSYTLRDETASYSFYIIYRFRILNPEHKDANKFLEQFYYGSASNIVEFSSHCLTFAFRKVGFITTPKLPP